MPIKDSQARSCSKPCRISADRTAAEEAEQDCADTEIQRDRLRMTSAIFDLRSRASRGRRDSFRVPTEPPHLRRIRVGQDICARATLTRSSYAVGYACIESAQEIRLYSRRRRHDERMSTRLRIVARRKCLEHAEAKGRSANAAARQRETDGVVRQLPVAGSVTDGVSSWRLMRRRRMNSPPFPRARPDTRPSPPAACRRPFRRS